MENVCTKGKEGWMRGDVKCGMRMRDKKMRRNQILLLMVTGDGGGMMDLRWRIRKM